MPLTLGLAARIKSETLQHHEAAEQQLVPVLHQLNSTTKYCRLLKTFYGFYAPLEKQIAIHITPESLPDIAERRHAFHALEDLRALGDEEAPVLCSQLPEINNTAAAFGALYVLEGSTLGGRMIRKMLLSNPDLNLEEKQVGFFNGYGDRTSEKWKNFQKHLDQQEEEAMIIAAAKQSFFTFQQWINLSLYDGHHLPK